MRILISSHFYTPSVGGIETSTALLAEEWIKAGHEVRVITTTVDPDDRNHPIPVVRNPSSRRIFEELAWCDLYFQNNISLKTLWPALIIRKPTVITHQTWFSHGIVGFIKSLACSLVDKTVAISEAIRKETDADLVIPNPYQSEVFEEKNEISRDRELIFAGRLVSDKGVDILIEALALLEKQDFRPILTIVGDGPEESTLRDLVRSRDLENHVIFTGKKNAPELASLLLRHRIMLIPSRWAEPFGIVALEGIACGCVVVGSDRGGLPEAIGPCGLLFPNGDSKRLAKLIESLLKNTSLLKSFSDSSIRKNHLKVHTPSQIAKKYLELFESF
jgi:glycogen synthase